MARKEPARTLGPKPNPDWTPAPTGRDNEGYLRCGECHRLAEECLMVIFYGHRKAGCRGIIHPDTGQHECGGGKQ